MAVFLAEDPLLGIHLNVDVGHHGHILSLSLNMLEAHGFCKLHPNYFQAHGTYFFRET